VNDLKARKLQSIINKIKKSGNQALLKAYLDVLVRANPEAFAEVMNMASEELPSLEEVFTRAGLIPVWLERGRVQGLEQGRVQYWEEGREEGLVTAARNAISKGLPIDMIHDITGLDVETIQQLQANHG
jgi:hypothetical protein